MAKLTCICGAQISDCRVPSPNNGTFLRDADMDEADGASAINLMDMGRGVWECWQCGRIAFDWPERNDNRVKWYKPEDGQSGHLCK